MASTLRPDVSPVERVVVAAVGNSLPSPRVFMAAAAVPVAIRYRTLGPIGMSFVWPYTSIGVLMHMYTAWYNGRDQWIRDLVNEGIEPNPGPSQDWEFWWTSDMYVPIEDNTTACEWFCEWLCIATWGYCRETAMGGSDPGPFIDWVVRFADFIDGYLATTAIIPIPIIAAVGGLVNAAFPVPRQLSTPIAVTIEAALFTTSRTSLDSALGSVILPLTSIIRNSIFVPLITRIYVRVIIRTIVSVFEVIYGWVRDLTTEGIEPNPGPKCNRCNKNVGDLRIHASQCKAKKSIKSKGRAGKSKAAPSLTQQGIQDAEIKKEFNKEISVVVCRKLATVGHCDLCTLDDLPIRHRIETVKQTLAICGLRTEVAETDRNFMAMAVSGICNNEVWRELGENLLRYFGLPMIAEARCLDCPPGMIHPELVHAVNARPVRTVEDEIKSRQNQAILDTTPETIVYPGFGVITGCSRDLQVQAPAYSCPIQDYDIVVFNTFYDILPYLNTPCSPVIEDYIENNWDWINERLVALGLVPADWTARFWATIKSSRPGFFALPETIVLRVPKANEINVTELSVDAMVDSPILEVNFNNRPNFWGPLVLTTTLLSAWKPIFVLATMGCCALAATFSSPTYVVSPNNDPVVLHRETSPLSLRMDLPQSNRLEVHPSNLVAASIIKLSRYENGFLAGKCVYCPELLFAHVRANVLLSDVGMHRTYWSNLIAKNSIFSYPSRWHPYVLESINTFNLLTERSVPVRPLTRVQLYNPFGAVLLAMVICVVRFKIFNYNRETSMGGTDPGPRQRWLFGHRRLLRTLPRPVVKNVKIKPYGRRGKCPDYDSIVYRPMMTSSAFRVKGVCDWMPDISWPSGMLQALTGRVASKSPDDDLDWDHYYKFVETKCPQLFPRLAKFDIFTIEDWIQLTHYTEAEKAEFRHLWFEWFPELHNHEDNCSDRRRVKLLLHILAFIKLEFYPTMKMFRAILGRNDLAKLLLGCLVKSIETCVYQCKHLIKHIKWADRPSFIEEMFCAFERCIAGDMTSFEASIRKKLMMTEFIVYRYVADEVVAQFICDSLYRINTMSFQYFHVKMEACRASGDVTTALGNALICLFVWMYVLEVMCQILIYALIVEGDDNLVSHNSPVQPTAEMFKKFGLICKIEYPEHYSKASFCGMIFPIGENNVLTDPRKVLTRFGWIEAKWGRARLETQMSLYRGKALCNLYQYAGCPILDEFSYAVLRVTRKITRRCKVASKHHLYLDHIPSDESRLPPRKEITPQSRAYIEELFGVSVDIQLQYEQYFRQQQELFTVPDFGCFSDESHWNNGQITSGDPPPYTRPKHNFEDYCRFVNFMSASELLCIDWDNMICQRDNGDIIFFV